MVERSPFTCTCIVALSLVSGTSARAEDVIPRWAYPIAPPGTPVPPDDGTVRRVPGSTAGFTLTELRDLFEARDWFPGGHPAMPPIVAHGRKPDIRACGVCHRPEGTGGPENAVLAGLPKAYVLRQIADFKAGTRSLAVKERAHQLRMIAAVGGLTEAEAEAAATYYAGLKPAKVIKVIESATVPKTVVPNWYFSLAPEGGSEPLGDRIVEVPDDPERFIDRDYRVTFTAWVPPGSVARGAELVAGRTDRAPACSACHGDDLRGTDTIPPIAGRSPSYLMRQLWEFKTGIRHGAEADAMRENTRNLSVADMTAIVAHLATLDP